ncbi:MAG TPA: hypothetical protein VLJ59_00570 [Mycobacteriales bacterium]|nr:hypothetical protein [Mycobacteriales bacterium]
MALVDPADLGRLRRLLRGLLMPGQRELHAKKEAPQRLRAIVAKIIADGVRARIYLCRYGADQEAARQRCLLRLVEDLLDDGVRRLVLDSRPGRDRHDERTIWAVLGKRPQESGLTYEHMDSAAEQLLWLADVIAWCHGAGSDWRRRIAPAVVRVIDVGVS